MINYRSLFIFASIITLLQSLVACGGSSTSGEFEYVAIGASDASGVGEADRSETYVFKIAEGLEADGLDVGIKNLAIPGLETDEIEKLEVPVALEFEPELTTVFVGANDIIAGLSTEDFRNDVGNILRQLREKTASLIVIATIPDLTTLPRFIEDPDRDVTRQRVQAYNAIILDEANKNGVLVADLFSIPLNDSLVDDDGFHPSVAGHAVIASRFLEVIRPHLTTQ